MSHMSTPSDRVELRQPRGTQDILPDAWPLWKHVTDAAIQTAEDSGYQRIDTPMFEMTSLFTHATGEHTDVNREMYSLRTAAASSYRFAPRARPPSSAPSFSTACVSNLSRSNSTTWAQCSATSAPRPAAGGNTINSAAKQSAPTAPWRTPLSLNSRAVSTATPLDRPRRSSAIPAGDENCRPATLSCWWPISNNMKTNSAASAASALIAILFVSWIAKSQPCQPVLNAAPHLLDHLCDECRDHWDRLALGLKALDVPVTVNHRLVRGLDFYTRTVWEYIPNAGGGSDLNRWRRWPLRCARDRHGWAAHPGRGLLDRPRTRLLHVPAEVTAPRWPAKPWTCL